MDVIFQFHFNHLNGIQKMNEHSFGKVTHGNFK